MLIGPPLTKSAAAILSEAGVEFGIAIESLGKIFHIFLQILSFLQAMQLSQIPLPPQNVSHVYFQHHQNKDIFSQLN